MTNTKTTEAAASTAAEAAASKAAGPAAESAAGGQAAGPAATARAFGEAVADVLTAAGGNARTVEELDAVVDQRSASAVLTDHRTRLVETGLPGLLVAEASGGLGVLEEGEAMAALVAVARAAGATPGPDIAGPWAAAPTILRLAGAEEELVSAVASGDERLALVDLGSDADDAASDTVRLVDADDASGILVLAPGRITLVRGTPLTPASSFDPTRPVATVSRTRLGGGEVLTEGAQADRIAQVGRAVGRVVLAAELHGTGQELLRLAVEHLQTRMAFGRPLGSFQALKHRAADVWSELSLVGSLVDEAASRLERLLAATPAGAATEPADAATEAAGAANDAAGAVAGAAPVDVLAEAPAYAAAALSLAADTVVRAGEDVLQLHGGIGYTWESPVHILLKRAVATRGRWGTPHGLRRIVATQFGL